MVKLVVEIGMERSWRASLRDMVLVTVCLEVWGLGG